MRRGVVRVAKVRGVIYVWNPERQELIGYNPPAFQAAGAPMTMTEYVVTRDFVEGRFVYTAEPNTPTKALEAREPTPRVEVPAPSPNPKPEVRGPWATGCEMFAKMPKEQRDRVNRDRQVNGEQPFPEPVEETAKG